MKGILVVIGNVVLFLGTLLFLFKGVIKRYKGTNSKLKMPVIIILIITAFTITFTSGVGALLNEQGQANINSEIKWSVKMGDETSIARYGDDLKELDKDMNERLKQCLIGYASIIVAFAIRKSIDRERMDYVKQRWNWEKLKKS